jgi:ABC-type polar amino acid transport system ATPase subunit
MELDPQKQAKISREIDAQLKKDRLLYEQIIQEPKVLILGGSDSGKSTFLKQLKILHGGGFTESEMIVFRTQMFENIIGTVTSLVQQISEKDLWESDAEREVI